MDLVTVDLVYIFKLIIALFKQDCKGTIERIIFFNVETIQDKTRIYCYFAG